MKEKTVQSNYMKIHFQIANDIALGVYKAGDIIPTQLELSEKYGVSRATICEAIKELTRRKLLKTVRGKGTFVIGQPLEIGKFNRYEGFSTFRNQHRDRVLTSKIITIEDITAPREVARRFGLEGQEIPVAHIVRQRFVDGVPMSVESTYLLKKYVGGIDFLKEDLETGSLYKVLKDRVDVDFSFYDETIKATYAPERVAQLLALKPGEPILAINRVCGIDEERLVENVDIFERSDITHTHYQQSKVPALPALPAESVEAEEKSRIYGSFLGAHVGRLNLFLDAEESTPAERFAGKWIESPPVGKQWASFVLDEFSESTRSPERLLATVYPIAYLTQDGTTKAIDETAALFKDIFNEPDCVSAACAYMSALLCALDERSDEDAVAVAAIEGARQGKRLFGSRGVVDVEKRLQFIMQAVKARAGWSLSVQSYREIIGTSEELSTLVPLVICAVAGGGEKQVERLYDGGSLGSAVAVELYGALVGALRPPASYPRREFNRIKSIEQSYLTLARKIQKK